MTDPLSLIVLGRVIERGLIVIGGIIALWAGFRLFALTSQDRSTAALSGHGFAFKAERIGPGVFFALFGVALLGYSAATRVEIDTKDVQTAKSALPAPAPGQPAPATQVSVRFWGEGSKDGVPRSIAAVNTLLSISERYNDRPDGIKGADYVRLIKSLPHLQAFQRSYVDSQIEPGAFDRVKAIEPECVKNTPLCQSYNSVEKNKKEREKVLTIVGTAIE